MARSFGTISNTVMAAKPLQPCTPPVELELLDDLELPSAADEVTDLFEHSVAARERGLISSMSTVGMSHALQRALAMPIKAPCLHPLPAPANLDDMPDFELPEAFHDAPAVEDMPAVWSMRRHEQLLLEETYPESTGFSLKDIIMIGGSKTREKPLADSLLQQKNGPSNLCPSLSRTSSGDTLLGSSPATFIGCSTCSTRASTPGLPTCPWQLISMSPSDCAQYTMDVLMD